MVDIRTAIRNIVDDPYEWPADEDTVSDPRNDVPPTFLERIRAATYVGDDIKNIPPPTPLIDGWLDLDSTAVLYGSSGGGKTFIAIDWALSVSTGSWWMRNAVHQGPVVYVVAEGASGIGMRVTSWQTDRRVHTAGDIRWVTIPINLFTPDWTAAFVEYVTEVQPALVVFDTLARSMVGGDENLARDVGIVVDNADKVRRVSNACVLIVHHSGKDEAAGARGSSALKAAMNTEVEVKTSDGVIYLKATKQKDSATDGDLRLSLDVVGDSCVLHPYRGGAAVPDGAIQMLADLISICDEDGVSSSVWRRSTDVAERSFYRWQKQLVEDGLAAKHGSRSAARYIPTEQGVSVIQAREEA